MINPRQSLSELALKLDMYAMRFPEVHETSEILDECLRTLLIKQKMYVGRKYIEELQSESVYLNEIDSFFVFYTAMYFCNGFNLNSAMSENEILNFERSVIVPQARESMFCQLNFIRNNCSGCDYHFRHEIYESMRKIRISNNINKYCLELEFCEVYYLFRQFVASFFLRNIMSNQYLLGVTSHLSPAVVRETLEQKLYFHTGVWLRIVVPAFNLSKDGEVTPMTQAELDAKQKIYKQKTWKDHWGDRFEEIRRQTK